MSDPKKPWSVAQFEKHRPHMTNFVRKEFVPRIEDPQCSCILVRAPVKSGKRENAEYLAMRDLANLNRIHTFLSAWHRVADENQREELAQHNMTVFSITSQKKVDAFLAWLTIQINKGIRIILHLDECDHGTGSKQMLSRVWSKVRNLPQITSILYSATPEEVLYSGEVEDEEYQSMMEDIIGKREYIEYIPPEEYCGPRRFLDEGLIHEAIPFFDKLGNTYTLTSQGRDIISRLRESTRTTSSRNILVLRLSYSIFGGTKKDKKQNKAIYQFLSNINSFSELSDCKVIVDKSDDIDIKKNDIIGIMKIQWSEVAFWELIKSTIPIIIVIDQTCSRSTEWKCHDRIFAMHDFRNMIQYSTISQAQERVNHYIGKQYKNFQPIHVYGHTRTFELSAGKIDYSAFLSNPWKKKKIDVRTSRVEMYRVLDSTTNERHDSCPETGLSEAAADRLLQELGCYADNSLSARIAGSVREVPEYHGTWEAVTSDTWDTFWATYNNNVEDHTRNPFIAAESHRLEDGTWQGQHRGWKVLECIGDDLYQQLPNGDCKKLDLGSTGGNRIKVCYKNNELGIFIVRKTGIRTMNTLHAFNSMYC